MRFHRRTSCRCVRCEGEFYGDEKIFDISGEGPVCEDCFRAGLNIDIDDDEAFEEAKDDPSVWETTAEQYLDNEVCCAADAAFDAMYDR